MRALIRRAAEHPISVLMLYAAVSTLGIVSFLRLDWELLPALPVPVARVITEYPGIPAPEIEQLVTLPLENALSSVKGVREVSSVSKDEISAVTLRFDWGIDPLRAVTQARETVDSVYPYLPYGVRKPLVFSEDANDEPVLFLAVVPAPGRGVKDISRVARLELAARLRQTPGVASVRLVGLSEPELCVEVDGSRLEAAGMSLEAVAASVAMSVYELPLGTVVEGGLEYRIKAGTGVDSLEALRSIPLVAAMDRFGAAAGLRAGGLGQPAAGLLTLGDLAEVRPGVKERTSFFHWNGSEAVGLFFYKSGDTGSLNAARSIRRRVEELGPSFAGDCTLQIVGDTSLEIQEGLRGLLAAIALGVLATVGVLFVVFRKVGVALVTAAAIPVCMTVVFLAMDLAGIGLNLVSLAGMAIGIGMIVDNSIVVLENLLGRGARGPEEIAAGTLETVAATLGSTVTSLLVFLPVVFVPGAIGALFRPLALTVSFLLAASFLVSLSLTPALYGLLARRGSFEAEIRARQAAPGGVPGGRRPGHPAERSMKRSVRRGYRRTLVYALGRPWLPLGILALLVGGGAAALYRLPLEVLPRVESPLLEARVRFPAGTPAESCLARSLELDRRLRALPGSPTVFAEAGYEGDSLSDRAEAGRLPQSVRYRLSFGAVRGWDSDRRLQAVGAVLAEVQGIRWSVSRPEGSFARLMQVRDLVEYRLSGEDRERLVQSAARLAREIEARGLARQVDVDTVKEMPRLSVSLRPHALAAAGLSPAGAAGTLQTAVGGSIPAVLSLAEESLDIRVRLARGESGGLEEVGGIRLRGQAGPVETRLVGRLSRERSYPELYRHDRKPAVTLRVYWENQSASGNGLGATRSRAWPLGLGSMRARPSAQGPPSTAAAFLGALRGGEGRLLSVSRLEESRRELVAVFLIALALIYLVLGAQFDSLLLPLLLMVSLPMAVAGSLGALLVCGYSLNMSSLLGILIVLGTAVNAPIMLAAGYRGGPAGAGGGPSAGAILRTSVRRLRPIAATVLTTTAAVLPIALNTRGQAVQQSNTAVALIGGLLSGSLAVLLVFPGLYSRLCRPPGGRRRR